MASGKRKYRRAVLEDKEGVLAIAPDLYRGRDYLPAFYDDVIKYMRGYVCEQGGHILGFYMMTLVDGGETVVKRAGRVPESHQGLGIFRELSDIMINDIKTIPGIKYTTMTADRDGFDKLQKYLQREKFIHILALCVVRASFDINNIPNKATEVEGVVTQPVDPLHFTTILNCESVSHYLFPEGYVRIHNVPYKPIEANLKDFTGENRYVVASYEENNQDVKGIRLLSIANYFECKIGLAYQLNLFGTETTDFADHWCVHINKIRSLTNGSVSSSINIPPDMDPDIIINILKSFKITEFPDDPFVLDVYRTKF